MDELNKLSSKVSNHNMMGFDNSASNISDVGFAENDPNDILSLQEFLSKLHEVLSGYPDIIDYKSYFINNDGLWLLLKLFEVVPRENLKVVLSLMKVVNCL